MNKEDFLPIERTPQEEITSFIKRPSKWARFKVNRLAVVGATIILVMKMCIRDRNSFITLVSYKI